MRQEGTKIAGPFEESSLGVRWRCLVSIKGRGNRRIPLALPTFNVSLSTASYLLLAIITGDNFFLMSRDLASVVAQVREAVRGAENNFRSLYATVDKGSIPMSLSVAGNALDKLAQNLDLLAGSTGALSSDFVREMFDTHMTTNVKLSNAITDDMHAIASRLQLMMPLDSSEPVMTMKEHQCCDVAEIVDRYDRTISSTLIHYNLYVRSSTAVLICCSLLYRSALDVVVEVTHSILGGMEDVRYRLREQQESALAELRDSTQPQYVIEWAS
jgi:hypothetical protein